MRVFVHLGLLLSFLLTAGCGSSQNSGSSALGPDGDVRLEGGSAVDGGGAGGTGGAPTLPQSGQLTAGIWDDNENFEHFEAYRDDLWGQNGSGDQINRSLFSESEQDDAHAESQQPHSAPADLDVALVIDTTGSMGDEISYLQSEFRDLATTVGNRYENATVRWSLVVYRDHGDAYVVRHYDFTADADAFRGSLGSQRGEGGGDWPESPELAFQRANQLAWQSSESTGRIAFWVADAPAHDVNLPAFADSIRSMRARDVAVYPVASSGVDDSLEYYMRASAQLTGGRYIFITNDSGIGGDHKEPTIPCYYVTLLRDAILRAIDAEMTGMHALPNQDQVIRSAGQPDEAGVCQLEETTAQAF